MNVNKVLTKEYENKSNWTLSENEPKRTQSKPISPTPKRVHRHPDVRSLPSVLCPLPASDTKKTRQIMTAKKNISYTIQSFFILVIL
ncbi:MAG: hypothetical protein FVQ85_17025 [Planctomycetes bacterium]|nr:hypothetical protein [Planctomycetota bacterium]